MGRIGSDGDGWKLQLQIRSDVHAAGHLRAFCELSTFKNHLSLVKQGMIAQEPTALLKTS